MVRFSPEKLRHSLKRAGASEILANKIIAQVLPGLYPGISTRKIYRTAFKLLRENSRSLAARYHLKSAIMELGPSGFPFEKFIAEVLRNQGFNVQVGVIVEGKCINHEIDVIAEKEQHLYMVECKYHNQHGTVNNVKIPLYIQARFEDVKASWIKLPGHEAKLHQGWVVTNTRFTDDAIKYAACAGLKLIGWNYPKKGNLQDLIEKQGLYPLTCLTTLTKAEKQELLDHRVVLCHELLLHPHWLKQLGIKNNRLTAVLSEVKELSMHLGTYGHP